MKHLGIFTKDAINRITSGKKTIDSRLSLNRIAPYGKVKIGDTVYFKAPGGEVKGCFRVKKVLSFEGLEAGDIEQIRKIYGKKISLGLGDELFFSKSKARYATLMFIDMVEIFITSPIRINKKDLRGWMVLG